MFDENTCYTLIQQYLSSVPLVLIGSGNSCANGIPGMSYLADELRKTLSDEYKHDPNWVRFMQNLDNGYDLEKAASEIVFCTQLVDAITACIWNVISQYDLELFSRLVGRTSMIGLAPLIKKILKAHPQSLDVITTNYDRLIEYSCDLQNINLNSSTDGKYIQSITTTPRKCKGTVNLLKIHGSLDWFEDSQGHIIAIPLQKSIPEGFKPKIITPGDSKFRRILHTPFREILGQMDTLINSANSFLFIGYGFNDEQIQEKIFSRTMQDKPIVVVTKNLSDEVIKQVKTQAKRHVIILEGDAPSKSIVQTDRGRCEIDSKIWCIDEFTEKVLS